MKNKRITPWVALLSLALTFPVRADSNAPYSFPTIWKLVKQRSPEINAVNHDLESARIYESRMSRHWYPRVFVEGRAFSTNDPTLSFISLLGQRQIMQSDFAPQVLNHPGSGFFEHGTLGFDLPLFEGGAKVAMAQASTKMTQSKAFELSAKEIAQYSDLATTYSSILSLQEKNSDLNKLNKSVENILSHYKIGTKSNPVGYSGLLGLKNLRNRLEGLLVENSGKTTAQLARIRILARELPEDWLPKTENPRDFIVKYLNKQVNLTPSHESPISVRANYLAAESLEQATAAEKARFLPKIGLFGAGVLYAGNRGAATNYSAGAYLQWDVFSVSNFEAVSQAEQTAAAAQARADGMSDRAQIDQFSARQSVLVLEKSLSLIEESTRLLEEQTSIARDLFRNGSINALQFVEVLARRIDLIVNLTDAELGLAQAHATLLVNSSAEGAPHEN